MKRTANRGNHEMHGMHESGWRKNNEDAKTRRTSPAPSRLPVFPVHFLWFLPEVPA